MKSFMPLCAVVLSALGAIKGHAQNQDMKLNQLQVIGSHNSYKTAIEPALYNMIFEKDTAIAGVQYEHIPITDQLNLGLRNLEIDIYADTKGGRYAHPKGLELVKPDKEYDPQGEMNKPGFKIIHMLDVDFRSSVLTFESCLQMLKKWSDEHPGHVPVFITLEPKDGYTNKFGTTPEAFTPELFDQVDAVIRKNLGTDKLITPDMVRGKYKTLEDAVLHGNWPTLKTAGGKFFFLLDDSKNKMKMYMEGHPSLKGRVAFVNAQPGTPEAAAMFRNDADKDTDIPEMVRKGYIIRSRADSTTYQARKNDYKTFENAKKSGAQIISTDYYIPGKLFPTTYQVKFDDGTYVRVNPVTTK